MKLKPVHMEALAECARWADEKSPFWWRRASMVKLEEAGLVARRPHATNKRMDVFTPTPAGRAALASTEGEKR